MKLRAKVTLEYFPDIQSENPWSDPVVLRALESGVNGAVNKLDAQMKGWKPAAEGKETLYGVNKNPIEFWYQRTYTK